MAKIQNITDAELVHEIAHGKEYAFDWFYEQNRKQFIKYLRGRADRVPEDVLCDICTEAWIKLRDNIFCSFLRVEQGQVVNKKDNKVTVKGYLYTIGYHKLVDYCRANSITIRNKSVNDEDTQKTRSNRQIRFVNFSDIFNTENSSDDAESPEDIELDIPNEVETDNRMEALLKAMDQLNERCSNILRRFYYNRMSFKLIAEELGYSNADTAKVQKNKCMGKLKSFATKLLKEQKD